MFGIFPILSRTSRRSGWHPRAVVCQGVANGRGFYHYTKDDASHWLDLFNEFNYKIRRLAAEFSSKAPPAGGAAE